MIWIWLLNLKDRKRLLINLSLPQIRKNLLQKMKMRKAALLTLHLIIHQARRQEKNLQALLVMKMKKKKMMIAVNQMKVEVKSLILLRTEQEEI
jgi:hypothetical protein